MDKLLEIDALKKENKQLEQDLYITLNKIDKAIEWVKKHINKYECKGITIIDWDELSNPNDLLKILGDKDGTSNNQSS